MPSRPDISRRSFLSQAAIAGAGWTALGGWSARGAEPARAKAQIAITLDLEMSRNFPTWETTHWDYEKGNLDADTKAYAVEAAQRVRERGGVIHFFCVGRVLEQENVDWLKGIVKAGHPVGNHTYDHVYVLAQKPDDIQFRFKRAPWLMRGRSPAEVIADNVRMCSKALETRIGIEPAGFRTPGGFAMGLEGREDVQKMLLDQGFTWVSAKYPAHANTKPGERPTRGVFDDIVKQQAAAQPYVYPSGLIEIPMNPISDIGAFRGGRWPLEDFLTAIRLGVEWAIEHKAVYDFLAHPSCLVATDPQFKAVELICEMVKLAGDRAEIVGLDAIATSLSTSLK
ncbi:MAG TPA: polysaccharide deacetylase family protein [Planctomycetaceae bacterium]|jgi:peptidoglycan/xylan/chitin deacetylase (PgdA/CDA1 family)|nr:polysaccharide deacetylase family protein [Planctomycetaceae bacterium]